MKSKKSKLYLKFLRLYGCKKKLFMFYGIIVAIIVLNAEISLLRPKLQGNIIDDLSNPKSVEQLGFMTMLVIFLSLMFINYIIVYTQRYLVVVISEEIAADVRETIHDKLATVKTDFFEEMELSDILLKIDKDVEAIKQCGITSILMLISNITILIVIPPYMFSINSEIAIVNMILFISAPFITKILGTFIQRASEKVLHGYNNVTSVLTNSYNNWFTVRIFNCYHYIHERYKKENQKFKQEINVQNLLYILNTMTILIIQFVGMVVIWVVGTKEIFKGSMTIGTIMTLMNYQTIIMNPIIGIADFANEYHTALVSLEDIYKLTGYPDESIGRKSSIIKIQNLIVKDLCFHYPRSDNMIFNELNIHFKPGNLYAINAKSGKGKSTLFKLLAGIYQPTSGIILVDDISLQDFNLNEYWQHIGFVMQRSQFFKDSILKNINFMCNVPQNELNKIATELDLYADIHCLPDEWETEIKIDPYNFSEGQMRRMDILRNILKDPDVLFFDEPTANIDECRREKFYALLHQLAKNKIIIYSTHNKAELKEADVVINLD